MFRSCAIAIVVAISIVCIGGLEAGSVRNQALELQVHGHTLEDEFGTLAAAEGNRFLVVDAQFTSVIGEDLVFRHDVPQRIELASLRNKVFLHWDGRSVCALDPKRQAQRGHLPNGIVLPRHGSKVRGVLVFEVPDTTTKPASLIYFHDAFGPLEIELGAAAKEMPAPDAPKANQALELAVTGFEKRASWKGQSAPDGWTYAVVTLAGRGGFSTTTREVMLRGEGADPDATSTFKLPFEYFESVRAINMVVDGEVALPCEPARAGKEENLIFLPDRWSAYALAFRVPVDAESLALDALFGRMGLGFEKGEVLAPLSFPLEGATGAAATGAPAASFVDVKDGYRFALDLFDLVSQHEFHGASPEEGEEFLSFTVRVSYDGPEPGRDALARRFFVLLPGGLARAMDEATEAGPFAPLAEFFLAPGTVRRFELVAALPAAIDRSTLLFSGPGQVHQVPLARGDEGWAVAGPVTQVSSLEIETRALVKRGEDGHLAASDELAGGVRRPRPENIKPPWRKKWSVERDDDGAEMIVRVGDIDNFGFGWPDGYDPFSGDTLKSHPYPWIPDPRDPPGTDRIMVGSSYVGRGSFDGYTSGTKRPLNNVQDIVFEFDAADFMLEAATLRMFLDDFQPEHLGSRFQFSLDGVRLPLVEEVLNGLNQTGPVGKMVTVAVPEEALHLLADGEASLRIDDPVTGTGDGFAIDFVEILLNPRKARAAGTIRGVVFDAATGRPLPGALVSAAGLIDTESLADGSFVLEDVPAGLSLVAASFPSYRTGTASRDLAPGGSVTIEFRLSPETAGETLRKEGRAVVRGVRFDSGSATLRSESEAVLRDLLAVITEKSASIYRIEGHTDAEGSEEFNRDLSRRRAQAVVDWFQARGVAASRLQAEGFGEERPVASNATATGRALNRRVEILEVKK